MKNKKEITIVLALAAVPLQGQLCDQEEVGPTSSHQEEEVDTGVPDAAIDAGLEVASDGSVDAPSDAAPSSDAETADGAQGPRVFFVSPANGDHVGLRTTFQFGVEGFELLPAHRVSGANQGHLHVMIDLPCVVVGATVARGLGDVVDLSEGQSEAVLLLPAGAHKMCLQGATSSHVALSLTDEMEIVVE